MINSSLVSAQNRNRLYWTNIPGVTQPEDKGILLKDILDTGMAAEPLPFGINELGKAHCLDANYWKGSLPEGTLNKHRRSLVAEPVRIGTFPNGNGELLNVQSKRVYSIESKSVPICAGAGGMGAKTGLYAVPMCIAERGRYIDRKVQQNYEPQYSGKTNTLTTVQKDNLVIEFWDGKTYPVYEVSNGQITIKSKQYPIKLPDGYYIIRKLTVKECMRLQTVPDTYIFPVSDTQAYKMLGNGWTVDVIAHILSFIPEITTDEINVMSMYDGMSCGHIALDKLGANVGKYYATEIDKYAIQTAKKNYPEMIHLGDAYQVRNEDWSIR